MREPENNNYKPIFQRFSSLSPKRKNLQRERLWKDLNLLKRTTIPQTSVFPAYPSIQAVEKPLEGEDAQYIRPRAEKYLRKYTTKSDADTTFGLYDEKGTFYIGNKLAIIVDNDIIIGRDEYDGTPGLWELIVSKKPKEYTEEDKKNYAKLIVKTNALHRDNDPEKNIQKVVEDINEIKYLKTFGIAGKIMREAGGVVVIPSDPNALLERLDLLLASKEAGHTGVGNELVSICDKLKRQGVLDLKSYKKLISNIKI